MDGSSFKPSLLLVLLCALHLAVPAPVPSPTHCGPLSAEDLLPLCSRNACFVVRHCLEDLAAGGSAPFLTGVCVFSPSMQTGRDLQKALGHRASVRTLSIALEQSVDGRRFELVAGVSGRFLFAPAGTRLDEQNCSELCAGHMHPTPHHSTAQHSTDTSLDWSPLLLDISHSLPLPCENEIPRLHLPCIALRWPAALCGGSHGPLQQLQPLGGCSLGVETGCLRPGLQCFGTENFPVHIHAVRGQRCPQC